MLTDHTEYEEYHKLQLCTVFKYQYNNTLGKILSNYRYRKNPQKYRDIIFFQYRTPLSITIYILIQLLIDMQLHVQKYYLHFKLNT